MLTPPCNLVYGYGVEMKIAITPKNAMPDFVLDPKLLEDCHTLGSFDNSILLLMRNALFPWFVLVPQAKEIEFYRLDLELQLEILGQINFLSQFIDENYSIDKINIGAIGNIVSQLHVHVVGRRKTDVCWPGVVWGTTECEPYEPEQVELIREKLVISSGGPFLAHDVCV